jgi:hypothetical protein
MSISLVQATPQGELQRLMDFAVNFSRDRQPYAAVLLKPNRKRDYRTGTPAISLNRRYSLDEYPALAIGIYVDLFC